MAESGLRRLWDESLKDPPAFPGAMEAWRNAVVGCGLLEGFHGRLDLVNVKSETAHEVDLDEALDLIAERAIERGRNKARSAMRGPGNLESH